MSTLTLKNGYSWHPKYLWRQDTPAMQLIALWSAFHGNYSNFQEDIITQEKFNLFLEQFTPQMAELVSRLRVTSEWGASYPHEEG